MNIPRVLSEFNPDEIREKLVKLGEDHAERKAAASLLEESRKVLLAKLARESNAKSLGDRENEARCRDEYGAHIASMIEARKEADKALVRYESAKTWVELSRSLESSRREEMKMGRF